MSVMVEAVAGQAVRAMATVFGHKWDSDAEIALYIRALGDLDPARVVAACEDLAKTEKFWPRPVLVRDRVQALERSARIAQPKPFTVGESWVNPETGEYEALYRCRECQDTGFVPLSARENGHVLSWSDVRLGEVKHACVRRCGCGKLRAPRDGRTA